MVDAQEWLDENYPDKNERRKESDLVISNLNLQGFLCLDGFIGLRSLDCSENQLTGLDLNDCSKIVDLFCQNNLLTNLDFLVQIKNKKKLNYLDIRDNNFSQGKLICFRPFINLTLKINAIDLSQEFNEIYDHLCQSLESCKEGAVDIKEWKKTNWERHSRSAERVRRQKEIEKKNQELEKRTEEIQKRLNEFLFQEEKNKVVYSELAEVKYKEEIVRKDKENQELKSRIIDLEKNLEKLKDEKSQVFSPEEISIFISAINFLEAKKNFLNARKEIIGKLRECFDRLGNNYKRCEIASEVGNTISNIGGSLTITTFGVPKAVGEAIKAGGNFSKIFFSSKGDKQFKIILDEKSELSKLEESYNCLDFITKRNSGLEISSVINNVFLKLESRLLPKVKFFGIECEIFDVLISDDLLVSKVSLAPDDMKKAIISLHKNLEDKLELELIERERDFEKLVIERFGEKYVGWNFFALKEILSKDLQSKIKEQFQEASQAARSLQRHI